MSPKLHTVHMGRLIHLQDEVIEDFVADVNLAQSLYESEGFSETGLAEHAAELRQMAEDTEDRLFDSTSTHGSVIAVWPKLIDLAAGSATEAGREFLEAFSYTRVNRMLAAEFGEAETDTIIVLRGIANSVVEKKLLSESPDEVHDFFNLYFSRDILDAIYPTIGTDDVHPDLAAHIDALHRKKRADYNPALARVISTLIARECGLVRTIPTEIRSGTLVLSRSLFKDTGLKVRGPRLQIISWENDEDEVVEQIDEIDEVEDNGDETTEEHDYIPDPTSAINFRISDGLCHIEKTPEMEEELYQFLKYRMSDIMFPNQADKLDEAKEVCSSCPVRKPCLEYALKRNITHGVWGGESERGRVKIRKQRRAMMNLFTFMAFPENAALDVAEIIED